MKNFEVTNTSYIIADALDIDCDDMSVLVKCLDLSYDGNHITLCPVSRFVDHADNMLKYYELVDQEKLIVVVQYLRDMYIDKNTRMNIAF